MKISFGWVLGAFCWLAAPHPQALAQKPVISPGGIVNAATLAAQWQPGYGVSRGALASIFGQNLGSTTASAPGFPLPTNLGGASVTIGGIPAPLLYVSPSQINLQVPFAAPFPNAAVVVTTAAGSSDPVNAYVTAVFGFFTLDGSGCGRGAVLNVARDGSVSLHGPGNSVEPGGILSLFGTGMAGSFNRAAGYGALADGTPAPSNPLAMYSPGNPIGAALRGVWPVYPNVYPSVVFQGAAPGFAGLDQFNLRLPDDAPEACAVPLQLYSFSWGMTQTLPISIHRGGGRCVDPPPDSVAVLRWTTTASSGITPPPPTDSLSIEFASAVGKQAPALPAPGSFLVNEIVSPGRYCPGFDDRRLDAGALAGWANIFASVPIERQSIGGATVYSAVITPGQVHPGARTVIGSGGPDVGDFITWLTVPPPIRITTDLSPGTHISSHQALTIAWEGGDADSVVTVKFVILEGRTSAEYSVNASVGSLVLYTTGYLGDASLPFPDGPIEIIVDQTPNPANAERFQASGLSLGGWHLWTYEFQFGGLEVI